MTKNKKYVLGVLAAFAIIATIFLVNNYNKVKETSVITPEEYYKKQK